MNKYDREKFKRTKGQHNKHKERKRLEIEKEKNTDRQEKFKVERKILNEVKSKV